MLGYNNSLSSQSGLLTPTKGVVVEIDSLQVAYRSIPIELTESFKIFGAMHNIDKQSKLYAWKSQCITSINCRVHASIRQHKFLIEVRFLFILRHLAQLIEMINLHFSFPKHDILKWWECTCVKHLSVLLISRERERCGRYSMEYFQSHITLLWISIIL